MIRKMLTQGLALALTAVLLLGMGMIASAEGESIGDVIVLTGVTGGKDDAEKPLFNEAFSKGVNGNVVFDKPGGDSSLLQRLNAGEQYDLIYLNITQLYELQEQGALMDLTDWVAASPILSDPAVIPTDEWAQVTIDGRIYGGFNKTEVHKLPIINKAIAEKAGIDVDAIEPTLEGYYEAFKKMQAVGGEGFYAFNTHIKGLHDLQPWFSSVGVKCGLVQAEDGTLSVPVASEAAIPVWEWLAKLYAEGLLDPDCLINETRDLRNLFNTGFTGLVVDWAAWCGLYNVNAGENYPELIEAYPLPGTRATDGDYMISRGDPSIWAIPINAKNPEGGFKAIEYMATQEGGELLSIVIEGYDWNEVDGKVVLTEIGLQHGKDHGAPVPTSRLYVSPVEWNPGFEKAMEYLPYASIELANVNKQKTTDTVAKFATQIINGAMSAADGVAAMQQEFKNLGIL